MIATDIRAKMMSHHIKRCRKRFSVGNSRNTSPKAKATCTGRRMYAGTIPTAAYKWKTDMATASPVMRTASGPL